MSSELAGQGFLTTVQSRQLRGVYGHANKKRWERQLPIF